MKIYVYLNNKHIFLIIRCNLHIYIDYFYFVKFFCITKERRLSNIVAHLTHCNDIKA